MNIESNLDEERRIAEIVFNWYKEYKKKSQEIEEVFLDKINLSTDGGRIELILLARLFSQFKLREEKAIEIWYDLRKWFLKTSSLVARSNRLLKRSGKLIVKVFS